MQSKRSMPTRRPGPTWRTIRGALVLAISLQGVTAGAQTAAPNTVQETPPAALALGPAATAPAPTMLPFLAAEHADDRFAVSGLTKTYDGHLVVFASQSSGRGPRTIEWLDEYSRRRAAAAAAARDRSNVQLTTAGTGEAASIPPDEKKQLEPPKPPVSVGIPSPVAIAGSLAGGLVLLVKLIAALSR